VVPGGGRDQGHRRDDLRRRSGGAVYRTKGSCDPPAGRPKGDHRRERPLPGWGACHRGHVYSLFARRAKQGSALPERDLRVTAEDFPAMAPLRVPDFALRKGVLIRGGSHDKIGPGKPVRGLCRDLYLQRQSPPPRVFPGYRAIGARDPLATRLATSNGAGSPFGTRLPGQGAGCATVRRPRPKVYREGVFGGRRRSRLGNKGPEIPSTTSPFRLHGLPGGFNGHRREIDPEGTGPDPMAASGKIQVRKSGRKASCGTGWGPPGRADHRFGGDERGGRGCEENTVQPGSSRLEFGRSSAVSGFRDPENDRRGLIFVHGGTEKLLSGAHFWSAEGRGRETPSTVRRTPGNRHRAARVVDERMGPPLTDERKLLRKTFRRDPGSIRARMPAGGGPKAFLGRRRSVFRIEVLQSPGHEVSGCGPHGMETRLIGRVFEGVQVGPGRETRGPGGDLKGHREGRSN